MVRSVGSFEAKTHLAELLRQAEQGDEIVILRRGARVAVILGEARYRELLGGAGHDWASALRAVAHGQSRLGKKELRGIIARRREGLA